MCSDERYSPVLTGTHRYSTVGSPVRTGGDEHGSALVGQSGQPVQHDATATCAAQRSTADAQRMRSGVHSTVKRSARLRRTNSADRSVSDCDSLTVALPTAKPTRRPAASTHCGGERANRSPPRRQKRHSRTHCGTPRHAVRLTHECPPRHERRHSRVGCRRHCMCSDRAQHSTAQHSAHCWASLRRVRVVGL
jgi:hypothetical protein